MMVKRKYFPCYQVGNWSKFTLKQKTKGKKNKEKINRKAIIKESQLV